MHDVTNMIFSPPPLRHVHKIVMYVHLSVHMEQLGFHWTNIYEFSYLSIFLKFVEKGPSFFSFFFF